MAVQVAEPRTKGFYVHSALGADGGGLHVTFKLLLERCLCGRAGSSLILLLQGVKRAGCWEYSCPFLPWGCWVPGGAAPILWVSPCLGMALMFSALSLQHTPGHAQQQPDALEEASTAAISDEPTAPSARQRPCPLCRPAAGEQGWGEP